VDGDDGRLSRVELHPFVHEHDRVEDLERLVRVEAGLPAELEDIREASTHAARLTLNSRLVPSTVMSR
jgi:hypothetical protein